jgi:hypothetical protein
MSQYHRFMQGDRAFYCGQSHHHELTREGKPLVGWITATVSNQEDVYVCEFPETKGHDSYVLHASLLTPYRPPSGKREDGPVIQPRRKKKEDD